MQTAPTRTAMTVLDLARQGRFTDIREMFAPGLRAMVSPEALQIGWTAGIDQLGPVTAVGEPVSEPIAGGMVAAKIPVTFEHGELTVIVSIGGDGWLTGVQLVPAGAAEPVEPWEPPDYADPESFDERDVTVGDGPLAVPGTLSLPRGSAPAPAVILLAGSGPADRDETIGRNKPFKDLAWGLASQGVAVLRFEKVTQAHRAELAGVAEFTLVDEYSHHAAAAIQLLRTDPAVDAERIFILGHSLGGTVAPRIAADEPSLAGIILLAGGAQPLHWAAVRQVRYLASLNPETSAAAEPVIETMTRQARMVDDPGLSPSTPSSDLPFGVPAPYWLDLRDYHPVTVAAGLGTPMLILQGGRDYQSTVDDDLAVWRAGLADRAGVTVRVYPPDNHLFFPGTGPSTPAEYEPAQHVDPIVVADIVTWVTSTPPALPAS